MQLPRRGHEGLRKGRVSVSGAEYFLTLCTLNRRIGLTASRMMQAIFGEASRLENEGQWHVRTSVVMPDHVHLLVKIGDVSKLSGVIRLFKGRLSVMLRSGGLQWQQAYFDHLVRANDAILPIFLYVFLNPYRKGLLSKDEIWAGYYCCPDDWAWFKERIREGAPMPEWLD